MKSKLILLTACMLLLLCACQVSATSEVTNNLLSENTCTETSDDGGQQEPAQPSILPACETAFTETASFPLPFQDALSTDESGDILLTTGQALYDYDTMWLLLEDNFPYLDAIKEDLGIDWITVKQNYRDILSNHMIDGQVRQADFIDTIDRCLQEFRMVGHLSIIDPDYWSSLVARGASLYNQKQCEVITNPKTESFYLAYRKIKERNSSLPGSRTFPFEPIDIDQREFIGPDIVTGYVENVPYIRISSFATWPDSTCDAVTAFFDEIGSEDHVVIDIRGNSGGDVAMWRDEIIPALIDRPVACSLFMAACSGELNLTLVPEMGGDDWGDQVYYDDTWKEDFPYIQEEDLSQADILLKETYVLEPNNAQNCFNGKIWVLIDERCYSAADAFAMFCKQTGCAVLVGAATGGNGIGTTPYIAALPYSGLLFRYEPYMGFNLDGTCNGTRGTTPDIPLEEDRFAMETCLAMIHAEQ